MVELWSPKPSMWVRILLSLCTFKITFYYGDCGEVVNAPDCGSGIRGFDPHQSPFFIGL